jgi:hypothetical protein
MLPACFLDITRLIPNLQTLFIRNACGRPVNVQLLSQCRAIEETMLERENAADS